MFCQAAHATKYGAIGLILFSDPADYAVDNDLGVYPDTWYLPGTGVQRGSLHIPFGLGGDPLSQGYPAYGERPFPLSAQLLSTKADKEKTKAIS